MQTINLEKIPLQAHDKVLDLGCGEGRHTIATAYNTPQAEIFYVDLCFTDLLTAKNKIEDFFESNQVNTLAIQANGLVLPFADATFDHIVCSEVLEHIPDYHSMLKEINRVLKPGGHFCVSVPRYWPEKICWKLSTEYHQVEGGHVRIFKSQSLKKEILNLPFHFKGRHWAHSLHVPYWWLKCLFWTKGDAFFLTRWYHKLLVWDLLKRPRLTQTLEKLLDPIMGKSIVLYFQKQES